MVRVTISKGGGLAGEKALPHRALTWADADDANFVDGILSVYHGDKRLAVPGPRRREGSAVRPAEGRRMVPRSTPRTRSPVVTADWSHLHRFRVRKGVVEMQATRDNRATAARRRKKTLAQPGNG